MIMQLPDIVQVHAEVLHLDDGDEVIASVRDVDQHTLQAGGLKLIHGWLTKHGYSWVTGTNGWWRRCS